MDQEGESICTREEELWEQQSWQTLTHHMLLIQREMDAFKEGSMTGGAECFGRENIKVRTWYDVALEMAQTEQAVEIQVHTSITGLIFLFEKIISPLKSKQIMKQCRESHLPTSSHEEVCLQAEEPHLFCISSAPGEITLKAFKKLNLLQSELSHTVQSCPWNPRVHSAHVLL